ncbi:MAG TPA: hypothetical protein DHW42_00070 [Candidatus Marinimicrobia bacterium]|nr:hypothetical protein [Candidatus Neomarinimicrobiota bacterium]
MNNVEQTQKNSETIQFRLIEIKKISYTRNDYHNFGYELADVLKGEVRVGVKFEIDPGHETFSLFLNIEYLKEEHLLFNVETLHKIHIKDFRNALKYQESGQFKVNDDVMKLWLQVAINDTRGMLVILNSDHEYSQIIVPLIDLNLLLNSIKGNQTGESK